MIQDETTLPGMVELCRVFCSWDSHKDYTKSFKKKPVCLDDINEGVFVNSRPIADLSSEH